MNNTKLNNVDRLIEFLPQNSKISFISGNMSKDTLRFWISRMELRGMNTQGLLELVNLLED